jgi:hypothetical protein
MQTLLAIRDAELEYVAADHDGDGVLQYASKLSSSPASAMACTGRRRPMSRQARSARSGFGRPRQLGRYHGYRYKLLTEQGRMRRAARSTIAKGRLFGGFAVIAWPVSYMDSGVKTFLISHDVQIYERDLGPDTAARAAATKTFDPGPGWSKVSP